MRVESPFRVKLREIPEEGTSRTFDLAGDWAKGSLAGTEATADTLSAKVTLHRSQGDVYLEGRLVGTLSVACSRCLNPAGVEVAHDMTVTFVPAGREETAEDVADVVPYTDDEIDVEPFLREELLLQLPIAPLCRELCKGLCPKCGTDLNQTTCSCPPDPKDDRWAALKDIKV